jgi:hypothetical protein
MDTETKVPSVKLDWARLLGFSQATGARDEDACKKPNDPRMIRLGAKFGTKTGLRAPEVAGRRPGA